MDATGWSSPIRQNCRQVIESDTSRHNIYLFDPRMGRPSTPMETYLRLMFLKFRYRLGPKLTVWAVEAGDRKVGLTLRGAATASASIGSDLP